MPAIYGVAGTQFWYSGIRPAWYFVASLWDLWLSRHEYSKSNPFQLVFIVAKTWKFSISALSDTVQRLNSIKNSGKTPDSMFWVFHRLVNLLKQTGNVQEEHLDALVEELKANKTFQGRNETFPATVPTHEGQHETKKVESRKAGTETGDSSDSDGFAIIQDEDFKTESADKSAKVSKDGSVKVDRQTDKRGDRPFRVQNIEMATPIDSPFGSQVCKLFTSHILGRSWHSENTSSSLSCKVHQQ